MIALLCILGFFFLIAIVLIIQFYSAIDVDLDNNSAVDKNAYVELENKLEKAANRYLDNKYENISDLNSITIPASKLKDFGYISDYEMMDCNGYVISNIVNGNYVSNSYVLCKNYKSNGYKDGVINE